MSDLELSKKEIVRSLRRICAHCTSGIVHNCPVQGIAEQVRSINGIPLIVNNEFAGLLWQHA